jgi:hypothetical protein
MRDFLCRSRASKVMPSKLLLSKLLDIAVTRDRSGKPGFVVASIGIVPRQKPD